MKSEILTKNGVKYLAVDGKIIDTLSMKSFRPTVNNIGDFYKAGIRMFHVYCSGLPSGLKIPYSLYGESWHGDQDYSFENVDEQIKLFLDTAPDAYLFINIHLDTREWWLKENPGRPNSFTHLSQIAADEKWRRDTADYLKALIRHVEERYEDKVLGYFLLGGYTTEWLSDYDYEESHPIKLASFRKYLGDEAAVIPTKNELERPKNQIFLDPVKDKRVIEYRKFHNELIADTVLYYAKSAQEVLNHNKLLGVFFGYIMELLGPRLWNAGHLDIDKVYRSKDIDFIATPSSYQFRSYNDAGAYMLLSDTLELDGKMYFCSFDHTTFKIPTLATEPRRICGEANNSEALKILASMRAKDDLLATRKQTTDAVHREFMLRMAKRTGMWWFDMLEGWFYDDELMEEIGNVIKKSEELMSHERHSSSEIAVIVSCESMYYVNKCSEMNTELICNQRDALSRMGAPYDLFSMQDIARIDAKQYKLYIFLDAFYMSDEQRRTITERLKKNGATLLFVCGADYVSDGGFSEQRQENMLGMSLSRMETDEKSANAYGTIYGYKEAKGPLWFISDKDAEVVARYTSSRLPAAAKKIFADHTVVFSGIGNLSHEFLRECARTAGVHIYAENGCAVFVNSGFIGVYNTRSEETVVDLGFDGEYKELFTNKMYKTRNGRITLPTGEHPAQMLIIK